MTDSDLLLRGQRHAQDYGHGDVLDVITNPAFDQVSMRDKVNFLKGYAADPNSRLQKKSLGERSGGVISNAAMGAGMGFTVGSMLGTSPQHQGELLSRLSADIAAHPSVSETARNALGVAPLTANQARSLSIRIKPGITKKLVNHGLRDGLGKLFHEGKWVGGRTPDPRPLHYYAYLPGGGHLHTPADIPELGLAAGDKMIHSVPVEAFEKPVLKYMRGMSAPARNFAMFGALGSGALAAQSAYKAEKARQAANRALDDIAKGPDPDAAAVSMILSKNHLQEQRSHNRTLGVQSMDSALKYGPMFLPMMSR